MRWACGRGKALFTESRTRRENPPDGNGCELPRPSLTRSRGSSSCTIQHMAQHTLRHTDRSDSGQALRRHVVVILIGDGVIRSTRDRLRVRARRGSPGRCGLSAQPQAAAACASRRVATRVRARWPLRPLARLWSSSCVVARARGARWGRASCSAVCHLSTLHISL